MNMDNLLKEEIDCFIRYAQEKYYEYDRFYISENKTNDELYSLMSCYDPVKALYLNKDPLLLSIIKRKCNLEDLRVLLRAYCDDINNYSKKIFKDYGISYEVAINVLGYKETKFSNNEDPIDFIKRANPRIINELNDEDKDSVETFIFLYLSYMFKERTLNQDRIQEIYKDLDYGLISIDDKRAIMLNSKQICFPPRIYDSELDKTIYIDISYFLLKIFIDLFNDNKIGNLSFRGVNHLVFSGKIFKEVLQESRYTWKAFTYELDELPKISMFHDENYKNKLIIVHKDNNIYIEEIDNTHYPNRNYVETQLVHIEYDMPAKIITHLDHEYIFYSKEEFQEKETKLDKKGTYKPRYKTFKLDDCTIPIDYKCDSIKIINKETVDIKIPFLYCVINELFEQKDLIQEYFKQIV